MSTEDVKNYVERYLRRIFVEPINITVENNLKK